ncbi:MAG: NifU family protein [Phycisphaerales bacterium]
MTNPAPTPPSASISPPGPAVRERVVKILNLIRPAVQSDGGDVELVGITSEGVVQIRLHGACVGCPSSQVTLQMGIEKNLKDHLPEIRGVQAVD